MHRHPLGYIVLTAQLQVATGQTLHAAVQDVLLGIITAGSDCLLGTKRRSLPIQPDIVEQQDPRGAETFNADGHAGDTL